MGNFSLAPAALLCIFFCACSFPLTTHASRHHHHLHVHKHAFKRHYSSKHYFDDHYYSSYIPQPPTAPPSPGPVQAPTPIPPSSCPSQPPTVPPSPGPVHTPTPPLPSSSPPAQHPILPPSPAAAQPPTLPPSSGPAQPSEAADTPPGVFDVRRYGAVGDGEADDTVAFKEAWDAACDVDSAVLLIPRGFSFMIQSTIFAGPCQPGFVVQVEGSLVAPDGPELWAKNKSRLQWLVFYRVDGLSVQGGGLIDGRGEKWWNLPCKPHRAVKGATVTGPCDSPTAIRFFMSSNVTVKQLMVKNSPMFHFKFDGCKNVHIESLFITSPALSPNTDGIHIENTNNVGIYNSVISNGDDCVSIGTGCYDVDIRNITCGPSHGISIGSLGNHESKACVRNITVRDSQIRLSSNGVRIKTWQGGYGSVTDVTYANIRMDAVRNPMVINQFYCLGKDCSNKTSAVSVSRVRYSDIKGTYDVRSPPVHFGCSDTVPCTDITLSDVELLPEMGEVVLDPFCWNAYGSLETLTIPPVYCLMSPQGRPVDSVFGNGTAVDVC